MLELINAQLYAEASLAHCFSSHWGLDGLKPYMRYSLAGGYQRNAENVAGANYCIEEKDGYEARDGLTQGDLRFMVDGFMRCLSHRDTLLDRWHRKAAESGVGSSPLDLAGCRRTSRLRSGRRGTRRPGRPT